MDNLTHGLLGLAIAALRRPDGAAASPGRADGAGAAAAERDGATALSATDKAALLAGVLAAELPDIDTLWPAANPVLEELMAHRGPSHSLLLAPAVALAATLAARLIFRPARLWPVYGVSLLSVLLAHLLPDLWTGWGTRVLFPFSEHRASLDLTMVVDPFVTLPLLGFTLWAWRRPNRWRRLLLTGLACVVAYVGARAAIRPALAARVARQYPQAVQVVVFPEWLGSARWRYVAELPGEYAAGAVALTGAPAEYRRVTTPPPGALHPAALAVPTVREAMEWARFPVLSQAAAPGGGLTVRIADLRYHLRGEPTLTCHIELGPEMTVREARLERGGSARDLWRRWRPQSEG